MRLSLRSSLALLTLLLPVTTYAAPGNVTGITAAVEAGNVRVTWQPVAGDIASYRIYYSHASILGNGGLFDDYETVDGSVTTHLLRNIVLTDRLSVSVLAVDMQGEESPFFMEEATVSLSPSSQPSLGPAPSLAPPPSDVTGTLYLLKTESLSSTGILLTFSHTIILDAQQALDSVTVETATGAHLSLQRITASGSMLLIETVPQTPGGVYRVRVGSGITGTDPSGATLTMQDAAIPMLFTTFGELQVSAPTSSSFMSSASSSQPTAPQTIGDITELTLRAQPSTALFIVEAAWIAPPQTITKYNVRQTVDGGRTFGPVMDVPAGTTAIRIPNVTPGTFGLHVCAVMENSACTAGITHIIELPSTLLPPANPLTGQVLSQPTAPTEGRGSLPGSGPGLWFLTTLTGALAGLYFLRRQHRMAQRI